MKSDYVSFVDTGWEIFRREFRTDKVLYGLYDMIVTVKDYTERGDSILHFYQVDFCVTHSALSTVE